jgi:hypothetical protein
VRRGSWDRARNLARSAIHTTLRRSESLADVRELGVLEAGLAREVLRQPHCAVAGDAVEDANRLKKEGLEAYDIGVLDSTLGAVVTVYRTPGKLPIHHGLHVYALFVGAVGSEVHVSLGGNYAHAVEKPGGVVKIREGIDLGRQGPFVDAGQCVSRRRMVWIEFIRVKGKGKRPSSVDRDDLEARGVDFGSLRPRPVTSRTVRVKAAWIPLTLPDAQCSVSLEIQPIGINHNVTFASVSVTGATDFASGSRPVVMPTAPGTYTYRCTIHPGMTGSVLVE